MSSFFVITLTALAGLFGVWLSEYIRRKKALREAIVCPAGFDCQTVITSRYSKFFGIPVENLGILYYSFVSISYAFFLFFPFLHNDLFSFFVLAITTLAFIFSIYLTFIQVIVLNQWCTVCLASAFLCSVIFVSVWTSTDLDIIAFLDSIVGVLPF